MSEEGPVTAPAGPGRAGGGAAYGEGGDHIGARRERRAFRLCVAGCVFLTGALYLVDRYQRFEPAERLYIMALTLHPESARAVLRQAVREDMARSPENRTARYVAALAAREEEDLMLSAFEEAYRLDPRNESIAIRLGCRLFHEGRYLEARDRFREARNLAPGNALPMYLEAAALAQLDGGRERISEALALAAQTNNSGKSVAFPRPQWSAELPQDGVWYVRLRRGVIDEVCAPLYRLTDTVLNQVRQDIDAGHLQYLDSWLDTLQRMGERLMVPGQVWAAQALAGIHIQLRAIELRERVQTLEYGRPSDELGNQKRRLEDIQQALQAFEEGRESRIEADRRTYVVPMVLAVTVLLVLVAVYIAAAIMARSVRAAPCRWTVPHTQAGKTVLGAVPLGLLGVLWAGQALRRAAPDSAGWLTAMPVVWWTLVGAGVALGFVYPWAVLRRAGLKGSSGVSSRGDADAVERRARRETSLCLMHRYFGILLGFTLCAVCVWVLTFRAATQLYPWQFSLLTTGLAEEELALVARLLSGLQSN